MTILKVDGARCAACLSASCRPAPSILRRAALGMPPDRGDLRAVTRPSPDMPDSAYFLNSEASLTV